MISTAAVMLGASAVLQFMTAWRALRLVAITGHAPGWILVALSTTFMGFRRLIVMASLLAGHHSSAPEIGAELLGVAIATLMYIGLSLIEPPQARARDLQERLAGERDFTAAVLEAIGTLVMVTDKQGRIVHFNRACEECSGWRADDVRGKDIWELLPASPDAGGAQSAWEQLVTGDHAGECVHRIRARDGSTRTVSWTASCLLGGPTAPGHYVVTGLDVTEGERTQRQLELDEARMRSLLELSNMADESTDAIIHYAVDEGVRLTRSAIGFVAFADETEAVLVVHSWSAMALAACAMDHKPMVYDIASLGLLGEVIRQRQPVVVNDYPGLAAGTRQLPRGHVELSRFLTVPVFDGERIVAVVGVGNKAAAYDEGDVLQLQTFMTGMWRLLQRKSAVDTLRQANEDLEARIQQRTEALVRSNVELQQFAYVASHDLQEPLRKVRAFADRLAARAQGQLDSESGEYLERIVGAAARMQKLINDLLNYSRVTTQAQPPQEVDLEEVVREVLSDLEVGLEQAGATVQVGPLPSVQADPTQMRQLIQNLVTNAVKFKRPGVAPEVRVEGRVMAADEVPGVGNGGSVARISVSDNGIGFEPRFAERIFGVFQRLHGRDEYEGTGIGLAVCRKIAERHGGSIEALGEPGVGATFTVDLPTHSVWGDAPEMGGMAA